MTVTSPRSFLALLRALVLRPLVHEPIRSLITLFGIAVGVAVLVAIELSNESALRAFQESVDSVAGRANFQIVSDAGTLPESLLLRLQPLWLMGGRFAPVIDLDGVVDESQLPIRILAVDLLSDLHFRDYRYTKLAVEAEPQRSSEVWIANFRALFRNDSIVLPDRFAAQQGLRLGSRVTLNAGGRRVPMVLRGTLRAEGPARAFDGSLAILDLSTAQAAFGMKGQLSRIDLLIPEGNADEAFALVRRVLPASSRLERPSRRNERVGKMLRAFRINLMALASVALLVGIFLVYNTVLISVLRRRRELGIFRTLGVRTGEIFSCFLLEGAGLGLLGSILGIALGYVMAWSALDLIGRTINSLYVTTSPQQVTLTPPLIAAALLLGTGVSVVSALLPAWEASSQPPEGLIRSGLYQRLSRSITSRLALMAVSCFVGAAILSRLPPYGQLPLGGYSAVLFIVAGFSLLAPTAIDHSSRLVRPSLERFFGMAGRLAAVSLPSSLRRTAVATAALSVAISMMVAVSLMVGSFRETVRVWVGQTVTSDLWIRPARGLSNAPQAVFPGAILEDLRGLSFIRTTDPFRGQDVIYEDSIITVGSGDFSAAAEGDLPMVTPRDARAALSRAVAQEGVLISESLSVKFKKRVGDRIQLATARGPREFPVTGIYRDYSNDRGVAVMDRHLYVEQYQDDTINTVAIFLREGTNPEWARVEIERRLGAKYRLFAFTNSTIRREVMKIFDQTFLITYALLAVSLVVAILGIVNTLTALIIERSREIALLKVLGMTRREIGGMIVLESALLGLISTVLGAAAGYALSLILIYVINKQSFGWTIEFSPPLVLVAVSLVVTFLTTLLSGLVPAGLANRTSMYAAMKSE